MLFGPSHFDQDKHARAISCFVDDEQTIGLLQELSPGIANVDERTGRLVFRLKMWSDTDIPVDNSDECIKVNEIRRGDRLVAMVKPYRWNYEGTEGVSLTSGETLVIERADSTTKWK